MTDPAYSSPSDETAAKVIDLFLLDPSTQLHLEHMIDGFASFCSAVAKRNGFLDDEQIARDALLLNGVPADTLAWFNSTVFQAEIARITSECGEAIEGARAPHRDKHVPALENPVVELADVIIRALDTANRRGWPIGRALVAKATANARRPYKHGKNS
jgi:NTP pyrophosphatase (non-canonical NTP hydrolase)